MPPPKQPSYIWDLQGCHAFVQPATYTTFGVGAKHNKHAQGNPLRRKPAGLEGPARAYLHNAGRDFRPCHQTFILAIMSSDARAFMYRQLQLLQSRLRNGSDVGHKGLLICTP